MSTKRKRDDESAPNNEKKTTHDKELTLPPTDDKLIWDTWLSIWELPCVTVAIEFGLFSLLEHAEKGLTTAEVGSQLKLASRGTEAMLNTLVAAGYIKRNGNPGRHSLSVAAHAFLLPSSKFYWGHMLVGDSVDLHGKLKNAIKKDAVIGAAASWEAGELPEERAEELTAQFHSHSLPAATAMAKRLHAYFGDQTSADGSKAAPGIKHLLDVGGGSGCFSICVADEYKGNVQATVMDLPVITKITQRYMKTTTQQASSLHVLPLDMFRATWPAPSAGYDGILMSNVLHDWNEEQNALLLKSSFQTLPKGGRILLHEMLFSEDQGSPLTTALFSIHMLVHTRGKQFSYSELETMLKKAGFVDIHVVATFTYYSVVIGTKP